MRCKVDAHIVVVVQGLVLIVLLNLYHNEAFLTFNEVGILKLISLYKETKIQQNKLNNKYTEINNLADEIDKLENDPEYIKRIAREEYQMARKDEKIYRVKDQKYSD